MYMVVGLGNPGPEYEHTRHNVGFDVVRLLALRNQVVLARSSFRADIGEFRLNEDRVLLVCPKTFMNSSGEAVAAISRFYKLNPRDIIVVLDEVALAVGRLRLRYKGSAGGHNGMANILQHLGTQDVPRVRIGVGGARPGEMISHVLGKFRGVEKALIEDACILAADAVECALREGFETAMNRYNIVAPPQCP